MKSSALITNALRVALSLSLLAGQILPAAEARSNSSALNLLVQKARSLEARDRDDLAAQVWQQVLITSPNQPEALAGLARWAKRNGKNDDANAYLSRLRRIAPDDPALTQSDSPSAARDGNGRLEEAGKLAANGRYDEAMRIYRDVFGNNPPAGGWAIAYYETLAKTTAGFEPAVAALKKLAAQYPDVTAYQLAAGQLMTYQPATRRAGIALLASIPDSTTAGAKAREAWHRALLWEKSNPAYAPELEAYLKRYKDPELEAASAGLRTQVVAAAPLSPVALEEQLGYRALKEGNTAEAEKQFDDALAKDNASGRAHAGLGYVRMKTGDFAGAVQQFEAARKTSPNDSTLRNSLDSAKFWEAMRLGSQAADTANWADAITHYQTALALRAHDHDALRALGGALLASGSAANAIPYLSAAVRAQPSDESSWCAFVQAKLQAEGAEPAVAAIRSVPQSLQPELNRNISWKAVESSAYSAAGDDERALSLYRELTASDLGKLTADEQIQIASLALHFQQPAEALPYARQAVDTAPGKAGAWEVLLSALVATQRIQEAEGVYARMPLPAQQAAMSHASFLATLASLKQSGGDLEGAASLLEKSLDAAGGVRSETERASIKLQLAQLLAKLNRGEEAKTMIAAAIESNPNNVDAWRADLLVLQSLGRQDEIVDAAFRMPPSVALRLGSQGDMVSTLARAQTAAGNPQIGVKLLDTYIARSASSDKTSALSERLQLAWLLLDNPSESGRLYSLLDTLGARHDLSGDQRAQLTNIWAAWISRSADAAHAAGDQTRARALLEQGIAMFPRNPDLERSLAGNLLAAGDGKRAFDVYSNWGLAGAQPDDYAGAVAAAEAVHNLQYADTWIDNGLAHWPHNVKLLTLAGERAQQRGDLKEAEAYWKEALDQKRAQVNNPSSANQIGANQVAMAQPAGPSSLRSLLVGSATLPSDSQAALNSPAQPRFPSDLVRDGNAPPLQLSSYQPEPPSPASSTGPGLGSTPAAAARTSLLSNSLLGTPPSDPLEEKLAGLESRNTPYLGSSMSVWGRDGEAGFSRLLIQQATFEASTTLANSMRATFLLQPTFLSGGTASGTGDSFFGRQTSAASFGVQTAGGVGAETQLSSDSLGFRIGMSPVGFLTHNWVGGFRLQPKHGPIAFILQRDSVKDTMLSYSGGRDPQSGQTWGGVMANTASLQAHWGTDRSGFYANGAYQTLDGLNVAHNTAFNGNTGTWWKVATLSTGSVTVGLNFSGMHYDQNLRYFTYGQGGYFSPQQYFLFNVPVRWTGYYGRRLQYVISGSLGSQHFAENASDYYPTDAALQAKTNYVYQAYANTGANFSFDARLNWQMTPHYLLGAFVTANNARDYTAASAGLFVKYTFQERPLSFENTAPSIPDWRGQQPFFNQ